MSDDELLAKFASMVEIARTERKLSFRQLERLIGQYVTYANIHEIESYRTKKGPPLLTVLILAKALDLDLNSLRDQVLLRSQSYP